MVTIRRPNLDPVAPKRGRSGAARVLAAACAVVGALVLGWLGVLLYSHDNRLLLPVIGIPLLMLIAWVGLGLVLSGLAWLRRRRP